MTFAEFFNFFFDRAFFHMPFMEAVAAIFIAMSVGAGLVGVWKRVAGRGASTSEVRERKAA